MGSIIMSCHRSMWRGEDLDDWDGVVAADAVIVELMSAKDSHSLTITVVTRFGGIPSIIYSTVEG